MISLRLDATSQRELYGELYKAFGPECHAQYCLFVEEKVRADEEWRLQREQQWKDMQANMQTVPR